MCVQLCAERRHIRHYWFTSWPDHHIPQCTAPLLRLVEDVETYSKSLLLPSSQPIAAPVLGPGPIIVHCRLVSLVAPPQQRRIVGVDGSAIVLSQLLHCWTFRTDLICQNVLQGKRRRDYWSRFTFRGCVKDQEFCSHWSLLKWKMFFENIFYKGSKCYYKKLKCDPKLTWWLLAQTSHVILPDGVMCGESPTTGPFSWIFFMHIYSFMLKDLSCWLLTLDSS